MSLCLILYPVVEGYKITITIIFYESQYTQYKNTGHCQDFVLLKNILAGCFPNISKKNNTLCSFLLFKYLCSSKRMKTHKIEFGVGHV